MKKLLKQYLKNLTDTAIRGDAREESYYIHLDNLIKQYAEIKDVKKVDVTIFLKRPKLEIPIFVFGMGKIISRVTSKQKILPLQTLIILKTLNN
ncbi:MAG: hypothetical protein P9X24_07315 [Candidatus Hatepunaea meridiana]|nr:hypothetical protein [Candidatus Hatepunaea meridiana]